MEKVREIKIKEGKKAKKTEYVVFLIYQHSGNGVMKHPKDIGRPSASNGQIYF